MSHWTELNCKIKILNSEDDEMMENNFFPWNIPTLFPFKYIFSIILSPLFTTQYSTKPPFTPNKTTYSTQSATPPCNPTQTSSLRCKCTSPHPPSSPD